MNGRVHLPHFSVQNGIRITSAKSQPSLFCNTGFLFPIMLFKHGNVSMCIFPYRHNNDMIYNSPSVILGAQLRIPLAGSGLLTSWRHRMPHPGKTRPTSTANKTGYREICEMNFHFSQSNSKPKHHVF